MASILTHPAAALTLAAWTPHVRRAPVVLAGAALAILPDADAFGFWAGVPYDAPFGHRGASHSLAFALIVGTLVGAPLARGLGLSAVKTCGYLAAACASHGLLDMCTNGGMGVALFWPISDARLFFPVRPIEVSPIGVRAFFSEWGVAVLFSEAFYVWLPAAALSAAGLVVTRRRSRML